MNTIERIEQHIGDNPVILFMKGSPQLPQCGFSAKVAGILQSCETDFAHVDVLANPDIRQALPEYANWPTFPQLYIKGELVGGCDIVTELHEQGALQEMLK